MAQPLAEAVAGARLVRIEGGGHELHPDDWAEIVAAIVGTCPGGLEPFVPWKDGP